MLNDEQKKDLAKLPKAALIDFVAEVQGSDKLLDKKIERLLLQSDKPKLIKKLTSTLKGLKRRHKILSYWESNDFVTELHYLVDDVMSLYPEQSMECLFLLELFMDSTEATVARVDDSKGDIGDIYRSLSLLWLQVAAHSYEQEKQSVALDEQDILSHAWMEKVKALANDNDYGTKDTMLRHVNQVFSTTEIEALIEDYKYDYERLIDEVFSDEEAMQNLQKVYPPSMNTNNLQKNNLETALTDLALALGDIEIFEKLYIDLNKHRAFSKYHFDRLMTFMIEHNAYDVALRYLNSDEHGNAKLSDIARLDWLQVIYSQQNDKASHYKVVASAFELEPSATRFKYVMAIASPAQQASLRKKAYELADQQPDVLMTINLWLEIGEFALANDVAVARHYEFDERHYTTLTEQLKYLPEDTTLIRVVIYRSLLNDILDNSRAMAYGHAARYYKHLVKLDAFIERSKESYTSLISHQDYVSALKKMHGKKYSFWEKVE